jgi:DNA-binding CsgD family transcriptional regulator
MAPTTVPRDLVLSADERTALQRLARGGRTRADLARRARIILQLADGASYLDIARGLGESSRTIGKWKQRFLADRVAGLAGRYPGAVATVLTPRLEARILAWTRKPPTDGSTQWSSRKLARALHLSSHTLVARAWKRAGLQPHRLERYMRSTDPFFETKAADVIGLYVQPPQHAAVFCLDEKTAIQALDRLDPVLPLSPGRAERHGFEY